MLVPRERKRFLRGVDAVDRTLIDNPQGPISELAVGAYNGVGVLSSTFPNPLNEIERARDSVRGIDPWGIKRCCGLQRLGHHRRNDWSKRGQYHDQ